MALRRHPTDSFDKNLNFWEEFPDYKIHPVFGEIWRVNRKNGMESLKVSSLFMWALSLCYDRKSSFFPQPEIDKWQAVSEDLFEDEFFLLNLATEEEDQDKIILDRPFREIVQEFEKSIDTPLGISLRILESKLMERTAFIASTPYTMDHYEQIAGGKHKLVKGTADQLDRMFRDTGKINEQLQKAMDELKNSENHGAVKGGGEESMSDGATDF